jgi:integrase
MASVEKRVRDSKVTWLARWRDPDGRQRKKSFPRELDAERHLTSVTAAMLRGDYVDLAEARRITVAEQVRRWADGRAHGPRTRLRTESNIRCHIEGTRLGAMPLSAVRPSDVQAWVSERSAVLAPATVRLVAGLVRGALAAAVHDRLLASNPAAVRLVLPRVQAPRLVPLTVQQVQALADAMPPRYRAMVVTQAGLGLRVGELLALRVEDVDFLGRNVRVAWQLAKGTRERVRPKTATSIRTVPLPAVVAEALAAHLAAYAPGPDGLIFTTPTGKPHWHEHYGTRLFQRAVLDAGLPSGTSTHDLRHHYASVLLAAGESVVAVAERLGHEDATLVLTTYGHLMPDSEHRTRRAVDDAWRAPSVPRDDEEAQ